jgi:hypothetical protein
MSYGEDPSHAYAGVVSFVSQREWELELGDLLDELSTADGRAILSVLDPKAHNYTAWCKVKACDFFTKAFGGNTPL